MGALQLARMRLTSWALDTLAVVVVVSLALVEALPIEGGAQTAPLSADDMVKAVDIPKLVLRSQRALAKEVLASQGKPIPPELHGPLPKTDGEKVAAQKAKEERLKAEKEEHAKYVKKVKAAKEKEKTDAISSKQDERATKIGNRKAISAAKSKKSQNFARTNASVQQIRRDLAAAESELSSTDMDWSVAVTSMDAGQTHSVQMRKLALKAKIMGLKSSLTDARRAVEDQRAADQAAVVEAQIKAQKDVEAHNQKMINAHEKSVLKVQEATKAAEAKANAAAKTRAASKPQTWQRHYNHVVAKAAMARAAVLNPKANTADIDRASKRADATYNLVSKANAVIAHLNAASKAADEKQKAAPSAAALAAKEDKDKSAAAAKAEEDEKVAKLKRDQVAAKQEEEVEKAKSATAAAEAKAVSADKDAQAAAKAGDGAAAAKAAKKAQDAQVEKNKEEQATAAAEAVANEAPAASPAPPVAPKSEGVNNMPEVAALHSGSVKEIAKEHFAALVAGGAKP